MRPPPSKKLTGQRNQCAACGEYFNRNSCFDAHRVGSFAKGERKCLSPAEMRAQRMRQTQDGFWMSPTDERNAARLRTLRSA